MAKRKVTQEKKATPIAKEVKEKTDYSNYLYLIFIAFYLLVDILPREQIIDTSYQHRFYLDIINVLASIFIFRNFAKYRSNSERFFTNIIPILYAGFICFAMLSLFAAYSPLEGLVTLAGYVSNFWIFANLFMLLYAARNNIKAVALVITFTLFYQVSMELYRFVQELGTTSLDSLIGSLKWNTGNKNIFAATIVIKLSFAIYSSFRTRGFLRIFSYLTVFLTIVMLFFVSARAAYISLGTLILLIVIGNIWIYWKDIEKRKSAIVESSSLLVLFIVGLLLANNTLTKYQTLQAAKTPGIETEAADSFVTGRIASIADDDNASNSIRVAMWKEALHAYSQKPFLGYGVGNYRIYSEGITKKHYTTNVYFRHAHNDFVEVLFESGPIAFLSYVGLFLLGLFFSIRILFRSEYSRERKFVAIILLGAGIGFLVDSFFNFPLPRTYMNVLFVLILSLIVINYLGGRKVEPLENEHKTKQNLTSYAYITIFALGLVASYINYQSYISGKNQYLVDSDVIKQKLSDPHPRFTYAQVDKMFASKIPLIGAQGGEPISVKKAKYLFFENRDAEALKLADVASKEMPYSIHGERVKLLIYSRKGDMDSTYKYSKIIHEHRPFSQSDFKMRIQLAGKFGQVDDVKKAFNQFNSYGSNQEAYELCVKQLAANKYDFNKDATILSEGLKEYPKSKLLVGIKKYYDYLKEHNLDPSKINLNFKPSKTES
ncbi:O-antigen ligase family protein [Sphingobacterium psychroaquaticum]|uniref:O-antigen ligase family protein n=1 Tax=Sphingobacterium psychroaquaticum TaxID=561061 RepID=UPI00106D70B5|nr:O-antigen ligase [Sphingobacterium psychroaquaticum]QBQ42357.1 O-antigen ligase family protein [Sphingobacterium psychroaquaticum]